MVLLLWIVKMRYNKLFQIIKMQKMDLKGKDNGNQKYENYQKENHIKNYEI